MASIKPSPYGFGTPGRSHYNAVTRQMRNEGHRAFVVWLREQHEKEHNAYTLRVETAFEMSKQGDAAAQRFVALLAAEKLKS